MVNFCLKQRSIAFMVGLLVMCLSMSACDTLKQKFIRHKKQGAESATFEPVLEPEEYPSPQSDPKVLYVQHYDLIKAWYNDLVDGLNNKTTARYLHYILMQVTGHITKMEGLVDEQTKLKLITLNSYLDYYKYSLENTWEMRNTSRIQSDLRAFDRYMRDHLRIDHIKGHLVKIAPPSDE